MVRLSLFATVAICRSVCCVRAAEPPALLIAASHHQVASLLPPLPSGTRVVVWAQGSGGDYATINARAMAARGATHLAFGSESQSLLVQLFRERLTRLGAILIDLSGSRSQLLGLATANPATANPAASSSEVSTQTTFANLFVGPQQ